MVVEGNVALLECGEKADLERKSFGLSDEASRVSGVRLSSWHQRHISCLVLIVLTPPHPETRKDAPQPADRATVLTLSYRPQPQVFAAGCYEYSS